MSTIDLPMKCHEAGEDLAKKKIITIVVSQYGNLQRTGIFVTNEDRIHTYIAEMIDEKVCEVRPTGFEYLNKSVDVITDFIQRNIRKGRKFILSVGSIEDVADVCIQTHSILAAREDEQDDVYVRYDLDVQEKLEILKRLVKAPSECFSLNIPRSCAVITAPVTAAVNGMRAKQDASAS